MAIILTVIHFKYIVQAACAFTPIVANEAGYERNSVFLPANRTNIAIIVKEKHDRLIDVGEFPMS